MRFGRADLAPVDRLDAVAGDERHRRRVFAMRQRHAGISRNPSGVVTPGTISKGMPAAVSASISSPPRPKINGSPPLSRTTV